MRLTDKHLDEQVQPAALVGLSDRRAVLEAGGELSPYANIMLRLEGLAWKQQELEMYAKVIRRLDESAKRYVIHFTSVPLGVQTLFHRLART